MQGTSYARVLKARGGIEIRVLQTLALPLGRPRQRLNQSMELRASDVYLAVSRGGVYLDVFV
jgi:hypothetical protein